jgi:DNA-binding MarR family transcriptional regulator
MVTLQMMVIGRKLTNIYGSLTVPICRKYGINQSGFDVLLCCAENPQFNTARDICARRGIKSGIASVAVESLIQRGLLTSEGDPKDRRMNRLIPTEKAQPIIEEGRRMQQYFEETLRNGITEEDLEVFSRVADKLTGNLERVGR